MQKLSAGNLRQADGADVNGVAAKGLVHFFINTQWLDRGLCVVRLAVHQGFALCAASRPVAVVLELAGSLALAGDGHQLLERGPGVADHTVVGRKDATNLGGLNVHMHKGAALGVDLGRASVAVGPAVTDADDKVTGQHGGVAVAVAGLQADHAGHQRMVIGNRAPAHQGWNDWHAGDFCKFLQQAGGVGIDDAATGHDQWFVCGQQHVQRFFHLLA